MIPRYFPMLSNYFCFASFDMGAEMTYCVFNFANSRVAETQHEVICTLAYQAN